MPRTVCHASPDVYKSGVNGRAARNDRDVTQRAVHHSRHATLSFFYPEVIPTLIVYLTQKLLVFFFGFDYLPFFFLFYYSSTLVRSGGYCLGDEMSR